MTKCEEVVMSLLYSVLKTIVRKAVKENKHQEETYEDFVSTSHEMQEKFKLKLPKKRGYEFKKIEIDGFQVIIGRKTGTHTRKALLYLVGGGERRWQMPSANSMCRYIEETNRDLWIPLYPLFPDYTFLDEVNMILDTYLKMVKKYGAENIAWLGFSAGADLILMCGRHIVKERPEIPMPALMIPVSPCDLVIGDATRARMKEIEKRDIIMHADDMDKFAVFYNHDGMVPDHLLGNAAEDDYTGFPKIRMYFGGDEIFAAEAPEFEAAFRRCGVKDFDIHIEPELFHAYPFFTFVKEGKRGEDELIELLK
jgi:acetyl esterase/lipase